MKPTSNRVRHRSRIRFWGRLFAAVSLSGLIAFLLSREISLPDLSAALTQAHPAWLAAALGVTLIGQTTKALRWRVLLTNASVQVSFPSLLLYLLVGQLANLFIPGRAGDLGRAYFLGGRGPGRAFTLGTVFLEKLLDVVYYGALTGAFLLLLPQAAERVGSPGWVVGLGIGAVSLLWLSALAWRRIDTLTEKAARLLPSQWAGRLVDGVHHLGSAVQSLRNPRKMLSLAGLTALIWFLSIFTNQVLFGAFGFRLPVSAAVLLLLVLQAGMSANLVPGTIGVFEYLCVLVLGGYGISAEAALAYGLALHFIVLLPMIAGLLISFLLPGKGLLAGRESEEAG